MAKKKRRVPIIIKVLIAVMIPVFLLAVAFFALGAYLQYEYNDLIFPTASIDGADVSWLTREEAALAIDVESYTAQWADAGATIIFPDGSALNVTGDDVHLSHNAQLLVDAAFSRGRGNGYIMDTVDFIERMYGLYFMDAEADTFEVVYGLDTGLLRSRVSEFTDIYNSLLEASIPLIYSDKVVIVKGAGQVRANEFEIYEMALSGLLESLDSGRHVTMSYDLPETEPNKAQLTAIRRRILALPLSARYDPETKTISESAIGVDFDYYAAIALLDEAASGKTVSFGIEYEQPEVTQEFLESLLFRDLIGECVTQIAGTENRYNNIILASEAIDGIILEPGEEFSFNQVVGRRTSARGYKSAPAFSGGQVVQAIGGGICQVSSTIYSAIKDTDIRIKERHAHGRPVTYLPRGRDATVSWGTLDFKFINNTEYPLRIDIDIDGRTLTVRVFGTLDEPEPAESAEPDEIAEPA